MTAQTDSGPDPDRQTDVAAPEASETTELTVIELAEAVLARRLRPRVADVRRLAEAVLAAPSSKKKKKDKKKKAAGKNSGSDEDAGGKSPAKKPDKKRKLSKIPATKAKG